MDQMSTVCLLTTKPNVYAVADIPEHTLDVLTSMNALVTHVQLVPFARMNLVVSLASVQEAQRETHTDLAALNQKFNSVVLQQNLVPMENSVLPMISWATMSVSAYKVM